MAETLTLTALKDVTLEASGLVELIGGTGVNMYWSSARFIHFKAASQGAVAGVADGEASVLVNGNWKRIHIYYDVGTWKLRLHWDPANAPKWDIGYGYYLVGDKVHNGVNLYRCKSGHLAAADNEPGVGANWSYVWDLRNDLDDGRKHLWIYEYSA